MMAPASEAPRTVIFLEPIAKPLLFLHLIAAFVAVGSAGHLAWRLWRRWRAGDVRGKAERVHVRLLAWSYIACAGLGALVYPTFRVRVRAEHFDPHLPWATGLFEAKEHLASFGLAAALALVVLTRAATPGEGVAPRAWRPLATALAVFVLLVLAFEVGAGWTLSALRSV